MGKLRLGEVNVDSPLHPITGVTGNHPTDITGNHGCETLKQVMCGHSLCSTLEMMVALQLHAWGGNRRTNGLLTWISCKFQKPEDRTGTRDCPFFGESSTGWLCSSRESSGVNFLESHLAFPVYKALSRVRAMCGERQSLSSGTFWSYFC